MRRWAISLIALFLLAGMAASGRPAGGQKAAAKRQAKKLPRPRVLDRGVELHRDPQTGELELQPPKSAAAPGVNPIFDTARGIIRSRVALVQVGCNVLAPDGTTVRALDREDFRLFEDGVEQSIAAFDASTAPASIVLVLDMSPSIYRQFADMKAAARSLSARLSPQDEVAVVAFAAQAHLLLPFSRDRALLARALASPELARVANSDESNIYRAVYLTARELFAGRQGRKAILLLTDGQDSGLGLSWELASAAPPAEVAGDRLTFEDVARELTADGVELYAISTENRPRAMTDGWLEERRNQVLITPQARELGMTHYTLYLAELVRRAGGRLYFLGEIGDLGEVYRRIAETLGTEYTLGYYPSAGISRPGWRSLRVELTGRHAQRGARLTYRSSYYVPALP